MINFIKRNVRYYIRKATWEIRYKLFKGWL
jgi:hypothetical protein